jgi:hypothetical protein
VTHTLSTLFTVTFDTLLAPFGGHADVALTVVSLLCGVATIFIFKATSNQARIRRTRDLLLAHILEMRIYRDDIVLILRALGAALGTNVVYLRLVLLPLLVIGVFVAITFIQLEARFGRSPLRVHEAAMVTVTYRAGLDLMSARPSIDAGDGAVVDLPRVRVPARREESWRLRVERRGAPTVALRVQDATYRFALAAEPGTGVVGDFRSRSALDDVLHPGLPALPGDVPIESVAIRYPAARHWLFGWHAHWLVVFVFWSLVGALVPKLLFHIEV